MLDSLRIPSDELDEIHELALDLSDPAELDPVLEQTSALHPLHAERANPAGEHDTAPWGV